MFLYYLAQLICKIPFNLNIRHGEQLSEEDTPPYATALQAMIGTILVLIRVIALISQTLDSKEDNREDRVCLVGVWVATITLDFAGLLFCMSIDYVVSVVRKITPDFPSGLYAIMYLTRI